MHRSLNPFDLSDEPEIAAIVGAVDLGIIWQQRQDREAVEAARASLLNDAIRSGRRDATAFTTGTPTAAAPIGRRVWRVSLRREPTFLKAGLRAKRQQYRP